MPSAHISVIARLNGNQTWYFDSGRKAFLKVPINDLGFHTIRLILGDTVSNSKQAHGTLHFRGIWLGKGGKLMDAIEDPELSENRLSQQCRPSVQQPQGDQNTSQLAQNSGKRPSSSRSSQRSFELVSDEPNFAQIEEAANVTLASAHATSMLVSWKVHLADVFQADLTYIPTQLASLSKKSTVLDESPFTAQEIYFRSGLPGTSLFSRPWRFNGLPPDVLILQLGSNDASALACLQSDAESKFSHSVTKFVQSFTHAYEVLVKSIRKAAHPTSSPQLSGNRYDYIYNSAPDLVPIILLPPLNAPAIIIHAIQAAVTTLRKEGDTSLFLLDAHGWLDSADLMYTEQNVTFAEKQCTIETVSLAAHAHKKFAAYLSQHVCPYLTADPVQCPFKPLDLYQGKVYDAAEDELNKVLLESKISKVKGALFGQIP